MPMKTETEVFVNAVENLGYRVSIFLGIIGIHKNGIGTGLRYGDDIVLSITADDKRHLYTGYAGYHKITDEDRESLMPLVYEFTATEPKER